MILVRTPLDELFNYAECREEYEKHRDVFEDEFDWLLDNAFFYSYYKMDGSFIGCLFYYGLNGKLMLNAYAPRGHRKEKKECLEMSFEWFDNDIYAQPENRVARICLLQAGFSKVDNEENLYIRRKQ